MTVTRYWGGDAHRYQISIASDPADFSQGALGRLLSAVLADVNREPADADPLGLRASWCAQT